MCHEKCVGGYAMGVADSLTERIQKRFRGCLQNRLDAVVKMTVGYKLLGTFKFFELI